MTTLTDGISSVTFSDDLAWTDELSWQPVEQAVQRTITGALIVQSSALVAGRPITLSPPDDSSGWLTRAVVDQLRVWAAAPGLEMTLTLRGTAHDVIWRHQDGALEATPLIPFADPDADDYYSATLRFMEI